MTQCHTLTAPNHPTETDTANNAATRSAPQRLTVGPRDKDVTRARYQIGPDPYDVASTKRTNSLADNSRRLLLAPERTRPLRPTSFDARTPNNCSTMGVVRVFNKCYNSVY